MSNMWQKIVSMVRKTGDRCIVFDSQTEDAFVVMDFGSYERNFECDSDMAEGCCGGHGHETPAVEIPKAVATPKSVLIQPENSILAFIAPVKSIAPPFLPPPARLTPKTIPDTINPDFDVPLPDASDVEEETPQESSSDLSEESVGTPSHFYLEPIE